MKANWNSQSETTNNFRYLIQNIVNFTLTLASLIEFFGRTRFRCHLHTRNLASNK